MKVAIIGFNDSTPKLIQEIKDQYNNSPDIQIWLDQDADRTICALDSLEIQGIKNLREKIQDYSDFLIHRKIKRIQNKELYEQNFFQLVYENTFETEKQKFELEVDELFNKVYFCPGYFVKRKPIFENGKKALNEDRFEEKIISDIDFLLDFENIIKNKKSLSLFVSDSLGLKITKLLLKKLNQDIKLRLNFLDGKKIFSSEKLDENESEEVKIEIRSILEKSIDKHQEEIEAWARNGKKGEKPSEPDFNIFKYENYELRSFEEFIEEDSMYLTLDLLQNEKHKKDLAIVQSDLVIVSKGSLEVESYSALGELKIETIY